MVLAPAAYGASDKSKETPGIAAYQTMKGAFRRNRQISRHIFRREHKKRSSEAVHTDEAATLSESRRDVAARRCAAVSPGR
ncbi:hypothetical protein XH80_15715 [Bradyrhizobium sp. CCBAU 45384]|nr:hypothetical protein [Bradyrhizobium sp. CCBAU 45384]